MGVLKKNFRLYHIFILWKLNMALTIRELFGDVMPGQGPIVCPSGNQVYIHPISGDLQQCSQQLGFYNQTTCPGGTVCERFPILVPGFQDYCCWGNDTSVNEFAILGTTTDMPEEMLQFTTDNIYTSSTDYITTSSPENSEESISTTSNVIGSISSNTKGGRGGFRGKGRKKISEESDEWITTKAPKTRKTRRPRLNRKKTTTVDPDPTTTTTTTMKPLPPRRGPKCQNPDDAALIDFGNRLRDCYYQQCPYGYRCEFNTEIRRYICCGKERDVFPPPGLPPLPDPVPLIPGPFRPRPGQQGPYGGQGQGPEFLTLSSDTHKLLEMEPECPLGAEHRAHPLGSATFCDPENLNFVCPGTHPYCVHSNICGAHVCCDKPGTIVYSKSEE